LYIALRNTPFQVLLNLRTVCGPVAVHTLSIVQRLKNKNWTKSFRNGISFSPRVQVGQLGLFDLFLIFGFYLAIPTGLMLTKTIEILIIFINNNSWWNFLLHLFLNWYLIWLLYEPKHVFSKPRVWFLAPFCSSHYVWYRVWCIALFYHLVYSDVTRIPRRHSRSFYSSIWLVGWLVGYRNKLNVSLWSDIIFIYL
jgi:hypothetical protein